MFNKILIANRGEIACRVMRTATRLGIRTVAVHSEADASALHVELADQSVAIGPAPVAQSYLNIANILQAAKQTGAEAIHPGYGFLSENEDFAAACERAGIVFIGPRAAAIRAMGSKSEAKTIMAKAGVPLVPGYHGEEQSAAHLKKEAARIGYPVLIKASAGGGGKGMRVVMSEKDFKTALEGCQREAKSAFGDARVLIEKYLDRPRHIEIQVFRDSHGNALHLFERDCSIQRRYQKVLEEAPAPGMSAELRAEMGHIAVAAADAIDYLGAGTIEFIVDQSRQFYFMEMNTRLQVEHPVTELITGQDLVEWQLRVAAGEPLALRQGQLAIHGHAVEARLYAEDPDRDFLPSTGRLTLLRFPAPGPHLRIDSGVREGDDITMHYDPMIAKLIVWDRDRNSCMRRLKTTLEAVAVAGVSTNNALLSAIAGHAQYRDGNFDTGFIAVHQQELAAACQSPLEQTLALAALQVLLDRERRVAREAANGIEPGSPWNHCDGWRMNFDDTELLMFEFGGRKHTVGASRRSGGFTLTIDGRNFGAGGHFDEDGILLAHVNGARLRALAVVDGRRLTLIVAGIAHTLSLVTPVDHVGTHDVLPGSLASPMPGRIVQIRVKPGDIVKRGAALLVIEAMKMEHTVTAPDDGTVTAIHYAAGDMIDEGATLLVVKTAGAVND